MQAANQANVRVISPSARRVVAHPFKVVAVFLLVAVASGILIPDEIGWLELLRTFAIVGGIAVVATTAGIVAIRHRPPRKPRRPRRKVARLARVGGEPSATIPLRVESCTICGRRLTNLQSQLAGVGPDCGQRYGLRPQFQVNPAFTAWQYHRQRVLEEQSRTQVDYDTAHAHAMVNYEKELHLREMQLATPLAQARSRTYQVSRRTVVIDMGIAVSFLLSELITRIVNDAGLTI